MDMVESQRREDGFRAADLFLSGTRRQFLEQVAKAKECRML